MNRKADRAQIESEDVAAVNVLSTGDRDSRARNTKIDDLNVFIPVHRGIETRGT
jgi:hypothetical protein